jgi:hypothetical protein
LRAEPSVISSVDAMSLLLFFCHWDSWLWPVPVCPHVLIWAGIPECSKSVNLSCLT